MKRLFIILVVFLFLAGCAGSGETSAPSLQSNQGIAAIEVEGVFPDAAENDTVISAPSDRNDGAIIEIGERFFVTQMHQIILNLDRYLGRTIRYEGIFFTNNWDMTGEDYHFVIRHTFGCCGDDGMIGFEVLLNGIEPFPDDTWVEVTGVLELYDTPWPVLLLNTTSIIEMPERGREFVEN